MFKHIDDSTIINTEQITYFHTETRILKLASGESFQVDPKYVETLLRCFRQHNVKQLP